MTLGEKLLILLVAILVTAVLAGVIHVTIRNIRTHHKARAVHDKINRLR